MHYHTHDIELDDVKPTRVLWYASFLDLTLVEVEVLDALVNGTPIASNLLDVATKFKREIAALAAVGQKKVNPPVEGISEAVVVQKGDIVVAKPVTE